MRYLTIDEEQYQAGTTVGWGDFMRWALELDLEQYFDLARFAEHGITEDVERVTSQLDAALKTDGPTDYQTRDVAITLLANLRKHSGSELAMVTDGTEDGAENPDQSED